MDDNTFIELHEYRKSIEAEFTLNPTDTPDILRNKTRKFAVAHLQEALEALADLVHSDKDATKLSAAKAIIAIASDTTPNDEANPIQELFKSLLPSDTETTDS